MKTLPDNWPFKNKEEFDRHKALEADGYKYLSEAHELWMEARKETAK